MADIPPSNAHINNGGTPGNISEAIRAVMAEARRRTGYETSEYRQRAIEAHERAQREIQADLGLIRQLAAEVARTSSAPVPMSPPPPPPAGRPVPASRPQGDGPVPLLFQDRTPSPYTYRSSLRIVAVDASTLEACRVIRGESWLTCAIILAQIVYTLDPRNNRRVPRERLQEDDQSRLWTVVCIRSWARWMCLGREAIRGALDRLRTAGLIEIRSEQGDHPRIWVRTALRLPEHVTGHHRRDGAEMYPVCGWIRDVVRQALPCQRARPLAFMILARLAYLMTRPRRGHKIPKRFARETSCGRIWLALSTRAIAGSLRVTERRVRACLDDLQSAGLIQRACYRGPGAGKRIEPILWLTFAVPERDGL